MYGNQMQGMSPYGPGAPDLMQLMQMRNQPAPMPQAMPGQQQAGPPPGIMSQMGGPGGIMALIKQLQGAGKTPGIVPGQTPAASGPPISLLRGFGGGSAPGMTRIPGMIPGLY